MPPDDHAALEIRCTCGALIARRVAEGIEIRCRRCRRCVVLTGRALTEGEVEFTVCPPPRFP